VDEELFVQEVDIMSRLRHPRVILFLGASIDTDEKTIVMEYMTNGSLHDCVMSEEIRDTVFNRELMVSVAIDVAQGAQRDIIIF
jgi:serine/threonine protein kinase